MAAYANDPNQTGNWPVARLPGIWTLATLPVIANLTNGTTAYTSDAGLCIWKNGWQALPNWTDATGTALVTPGGGKVSVAPGIGMTTPFTYGAKGDGVTDDTVAVQASVNSGSCFLPAGYTFLVSSPIQVPINGNLVGQGENSIIKGNNVSAVVGVGTSGVSTVYNVYLANFSITGTGTNALKMWGTYNNIVDNVTVLTGSTWTNAAYWFDTVFSSSITNLNTNTALTLFADFQCGGAFNGNFCANWQSGGNNPNYGFFFEDSLGSGGSQGNTFNSLVAQAPTVGMYIGGNWFANTINGLYTENVPRPLVLGTYGVATKQCRGITFNGFATQAVVNTHPQYSSRAATIDAQNCQFITFNSPTLLSSQGYFNLAPLSFSGGGASTQAQGVAFVNPDGAIRATMITAPGAGYTSNPTVTIGGSGSAALVTATESGGVLTALTNAVTFTGSVGGATSGTLNAAVANGTYTFTFQQSVTFTGSVAGATSGTLSGAITNGSWVMTFNDNEVRTVTVTGGTACTWTGALNATPSITLAYIAPQTRSVTVSGGTACTWSGALNAGSITTGYIGGSGYGGPAMPAIRLGNAYNITIVGPYSNLGVTGTWPATVYDGVNQASWGQVAIINDQAITNLSNPSTTAQIQKGDNGTAPMYLVYWNSSGTQTQFAFTPPFYPR
jgi:hypothetical protein